MNQPQTAGNYLFTPEDGPASPASSEAPDGRLWKEVGNDGISVDATDPSDYKKIGLDTTLLPFVEDYGVGLPGKTHPYGMINNGKLYQGGGVKNDKAPILEAGVVAPATRAWEGKEDGVVAGNEAVMPKAADLSGNNDAMIEQMLKPKRVLKYRMSGDHFGVCNGNGETLTTSPDNVWLGLVYSDDESVFIPVADHEKEISLTANGQTYKVFFTGIVLPVGNGRSIMVFCKAQG